MPVLKYLCEQDNISLIKDIPSICIRKDSVKDPVFTIVTPTYKRGDSIVKTVESELDQDTDIPYNILIVDNNPERHDQTEEAISKIDSPLISYYKNAENVGMANNWNKGLLLADADWVVFCHDDDYLDKDCISHIYETIKRYKKCDAVLPKYKWVGNAPVQEKTSGKSKKRIRKILKHIIPTGTPLSANLFAGNFYCAPTCGTAIKKQCALTIGGFQKGPYSLDWFFFVRFSRKYKIRENVGITGYYVWAQNASFRPEVKQAFNQERNDVWEELCQIDGWSRFLFGLFRKDMMRRKKSDALDPLNLSQYSAIFRAVVHYYFIRTPDVMIRE